MDSHVRDDDFVVMVCTETYYRRVIGKEAPGTGLGVRWEGSLIYNHLYESRSDPLRSGSDEWRQAGRYPGSAPERIVLLHRSVRRLRRPVATAVQPPGGRDAADRRTAGSPGLGAAVDGTSARPRCTTCPTCRRISWRAPTTSTPAEGAADGDAGGTVGITSSARKAGLLGMGGIGKTVLATALVRDEQVRERFADGVFWLSFGREAVVTLRQTELARLLGDSAASFENWQQGRGRLSELTADRAALVVLDDVWQPGHAEAFTRLGPGMGLVVTTRDQAVLDKAGARAHRLDLLSKDAARALLRESAGLAGGCADAAGYGHDRRASAASCRLPSRWSAR